MSSYLELCSEEQLNEFYAEFGATKETVRRDVQYLIDWIEKQPHLPKITDEEFLANFLLRCKNSIEKMKKQLDSYCTTRAIYPQIFQDIDLRKLAQELPMFVFIPVPKLTPSGHRIMICTILEHNSNELPSGDTIIKGMQTVFDFSLVTDRVRGLTLVYDCKNVSMPLMASMLNALNKFVLVQNKINPLRYNRIYLLNLPSYLSPLISAACSIIKKETERVVVWKKESSALSEELPVECLPEEYGGTDCSLKELRNRFLEFHIRNGSKLKQLEKMVADLSKKPGKTGKEDSLHGMDGSFRKLTVD